MFKRFLFSTILGLSFSLSLLSQLSHTSIKKTSKRIIPRAEYVQPDYMPVLINKAYNPTHNVEIENGISDSNFTLKTESTDYRDSDIELPYIAAGFEDAYDAYSVPNDNTLAVSNDGYVVTMRNSKISFYSPDLELIRTQSLSSFTTALGIVGDKYDPRVIYDPEYDRFITVLLSGYDHTTNNIIIGFSQSSNPDDDWSFYSIPGNILSDDTWSDFPIIAITHEELFITVTNFADMTGSDTWDFYGCRIVQMNKLQGYDDAEEVDYTYHTVNPGFGAALPSVIYYYNVVPARGANEVYGPEMYFVSALDCPARDEENEIWPPNDTIFLVKFSGTQYDPDFNISSQFFQSPIMYGLSESTPQPSGHKLQTGYNTIKEAIRNENVIHFGLNTLNYENSKASIYHGTINSLDLIPELECRLFGIDTIGVAYPAMAFIGDNSSDQKILIGFNFASESLYPGNACVVFDNGNYSDMLVLKSGEGVMNMTSSLAERWGDYTTMQRKFNDPNLIYFTGSFGKLNKTRTWVSKISLSEPSKYDLPGNTIIVGGLYPVPASEILNIEFDVEQFQICSFTIYNSNSESVDQIFKHRVKTGKNLFSFNVNSLSQGTYFLKIEGDKSYSSTHKFVVTR